MADFWSQVKVEESRWLLVVWFLTNLPNSISQIWSRSWRGYFSQRQQHTAARIFPRVSEFSVDYYWLDFSWTEFYCLFGFCWIPFIGRAVLSVSCPVVLTVVFRLPACPIPFSYLFSKSPVCVFGAVSALVPHCQFWQAATEEVTSFHGGAKHIDNTLNLKLCQTFIKHLTYCKGGRLYHDNYRLNCPALPVTGVYLMLDLREPLTSSGCGRRTTGGPNLMGPLCLWRD